jgi:hypothetical protein
MNDSQSSVRDAHVFFFAGYTCFRDGILAKDHDINCGGRPSVSRSCCQLGTEGYYSETIPMCSFSIMSCGICSENKQTSKQTNNNINQEVD